MYFKTTIATDLTVRGYKVTAKEVQALTRFVVRQMQRKYILEKFGVTVSVLEKQESHWSGFHFSYQAARTKDFVSVIQIKLWSQITFPFNYLGLKIENLQQTLVAALGYTLALHNQHIVNTKHPRKRIYSHSQAEKVAQQMIQHFKVHRMSDLASELNICIDE